MKALIGVLFGLCLLGGPAQATTLDFILDGCPGCGPVDSVFGQITLTDTVQGVDVSVKAINGNTIQWNGYGLSVLNWNGTRNLTSANIINLTSGYNFIAPVGNPQGPFGDFKYGIGHDPGTGGTGPFGFTIVGWDLADFKRSEGDGIAVFFTLDVVGPTRLTGLIGTGGGGLVITEEAVTQTPIPGAVWLFAGGLAGLGAITRRRRRAQA